MFPYLKMKIALAIPASNKWKQYKEFNKNCSKVTKCDVTAAALIHGNPFLFFYDHNDFSGLYHGQELIK